MKKLVTDCAAYGVLQLVVLGACASENLQTSGLDNEPSEVVAPSQPMAMPAAPAAQPSSGAPDNGAATTPSAPEAQMPMGLAPAPAAQPSAPANMPAAAAPMQPAAMPAAATPAEVGGDLEGFLHLAPCQSQDFGHDCTLPLCQGGSKTLEQTLQLGGDPNTTYDLTIHVYGVVEPRNYTGGTRRAGDNFNVNGSDFWYVGGAVPANPGTYNSYEMHINPPVAGAANTYFLNSRTGTDAPALVRLDYEASFPVRGGGNILWRSFDLNCRQITNCNTTECGTIGPKPVTLDTVRNANPPPPTTFTQPFQTGANIGRGQWIYIDVTNVVARR
jgi:hypothetical protein